jgi:hypothetical protein
MSWPAAAGKSEKSPPVKGGSTGPAPDGNSVSPPEEDERSPSGSGSQSTVEEELGKIETKVYGKVSKNMPILKRIERLEIDTSGKRRSGSISERLKVLKETYGI